MPTRSRPVSAQHGPLDQVLEAEQAGAATIAAARREAEAWLAGEKRAIQQAAETERAESDARHAADLISAQREAASRAAAVIASADADARTLHALADQDLLPIVARHVRRLLPGGGP